jgi:hypothetical protein
LCRLIWVWTEHKWHKKQICSPIARAQMSLQNKDYYQIPIRLNSIRASCVRPSEATFKTREPEWVSSESFPTTQQWERQVLPFVTLWLTMWGGVISSKEKRIFYLSPILLFMSFMVYPPQILSVSFLSQVACLWTQQWERKRKDEEVTKQMQGKGNGDGVGVASLAARKSHKFVSCVCVSCLVCCCSGLEMRQFVWSRLWYRWWLLYSLLIDCQSDQAAKHCLQHTRDLYEQPYSIFCIWLLIRLAQSTQWSNGPMWILAMCGQLKKHRCHMHMSWTTQEYAVRSG